LKREIFNAKGLKFIAKGLKFIALVPFWATGHLIDGVGKGSGNLRTDAPTHIAITRCRFLSEMDSEPLPLSRFLHRELWKKQIHNL
jgi:hypothetical protein